MLGVVERAAGVTHKATRWHGMELRPLKVSRMLIFYVAIVRRFLVRIEVLLGEFWVCFTLVLLKIRSAYRDALSAPQELVCDMFRSASEACSFLSRVKPPNEKQCPSRCPDNLAQECYELRNAASENETEVKLLESDNMQASGAYLRGALDGRSDWECNYKVLRSTLRYRIAARLA